LEVVVVFPPTDNILVEVEFWIKEREEQEKKNYGEICLILT